MPSLPRWAVPPAQRLLAAETLNPGRAPNVRFLVVFDVRSYSLSDPLRNRVHGAVSRVLCVVWQVWTRGIAFCPPSKLRRVVLELTVRRRLNNVSALLALPQGSSRCTGKIAVGSTAIRRLQPCEAYQALRLFSASAPFSLLEAR